MTGVWDTAWWMVTPREHGVVEEVKLEQKSTQKKNKQCNRKWELSWNPSFPQLPVAGFRESEWTSRSPSLLIHKARTLPILLHDRRSTPPREAGLVHKESEGQKGSISCPSCRARPFPTGAQPRLPFTSGQRCPAFGLRPAPPLWASALLLPGGV